MAEIEVDVTVEESIFGGPRVMVTEHSRLGSVSSIQYCGDAWTGLWRAMEPLLMLKNGTFFKKAGS